MAAVASDIRVWAVSTAGAILMVLAICVPPAKAEPVTITGDNTRLEVSVSNFVVLLGDGIFITAIPPATLEFGSSPAAIFPVTGGVFDVENTLSAVTHAGGLRLEKQSINTAIDVTNITLQCTGLTGCRLLGTASMAIPNEIATIVDLVVTDDEAGTITVTGRAHVSAAGALILNTLFQTNVFYEGFELGTLRSTLTYDSLTAPGAYVRPKTAKPVSASLVPAFQECTSPDREHGPPLDSPSCNPPAQSSSNLTVGAPDSNGAPVNSLGNVRYAPVPGNPTAGDQADVTLNVSVTDVRASGGLTDYTGELQAQVDLRITDRNNSLAAPVFPYDQPATVQDTPLSATVPCTTSPSALEGSTCTLVTTADAIAPGTVVEGKRSVWAMGPVRLLDGGADGDAETAGNQLFMTQGVFVP